MNHPENFDSVDNPFRLMVESPLDLDKRQPSQPWLNVARQVQDFKRSRTSAELTARRLRKMKFVWIALVKHVESNTVRDEQGAVIPHGGGWERYHFLGVIDWYRRAFTMPGWWQVPKNEREQQRVDSAHRDGVWLTALLTSPWFDRPEFDEVKGLSKACLRDPLRYMRIDNEYGLPLYPMKEHESDEILQKFLDIWQVVANSMPIPLDNVGEAICGQIPIRIVSQLR